MDSGGQNCVEREKGHLLEQYFPDKPGHKDSTKWIDAAVNSLQDPPWMRKRFTCQQNQGNALTRRSTDTRGPV